jgi:hypothetical protein
VTDDHVRSILDLLSDEEVHEVNAACPYVAAAFYGGLAERVLAEAADDARRRRATNTCGLRITRAGLEVLGARTYRPWAEGEQ